MKKKLIIIGIILFTIILSIIVMVKMNVEIEYIPEQEIGGSNLRNTLVSLYYQNINTGEIEKETSLIDAKVLLLDPYKEIVLMLMNSPRNEDLKKVIPDGTKINNIELKGNLLNIDFSNEFINNVEEENIRLSIESIRKTLTELNEVGDVNITVEGEIILQ